MRRWWTFLFAPLLTASAFANAPQSRAVCPINRDGRVLQFVSDAANRPVATITPLHRTNSVAFNDRGLPFILRQPSVNSATNYYDALRRLTNHGDSFADTLFGLDANGNVTLVTNVGQASRLAFGFDAYDLMSAFTNADGYVIQYQHDNNGNITVLTYPGGFSVTNYYNALNQLTNVTDWLGKPTNI